MQTVYLNDAVTWELSWETEQDETLSMQSHSPVVRPWWCGSCALRAGWSWQTSSLGRTRPACSRGLRWRAPWRQDPSSLPRFHWLAGGAASVPPERLQRGKTGQLVQCKTFYVWYCSSPQTKYKTTWIFKTSHIFCIFLIIIPFLTYFYLESSHALKQQYVTLTRDVQHRKWNLMHVNMSHKTATLVKLGHI